MIGLVVTCLLAYGGALVSLAYPYVGFLIYILFAILKPDYVWYDSVGPGNYSRVLGVGMLLGWALQGFGGLRFGRGGAIAAVLTAFWVWAGVSGALSAHPQAGWAFIVDIGKILLTFLAGLTLIDSKLRLRLLAWVIVSSQGIVALLLEIDYLHGFNRAKEVGFAGMDNNAMAIGMVTCFGLGVFLAFGERRWTAKTAALASALLMAHVILISDSRGGMLALIAAILTGFAMILRRPAHVALFLIGALLLVMLTGPAARERLKSSFASEEQRDESAQSRLQLWRDNSEVMMKNPLFGCGPYGWPLIANEFGWRAGKQGHSLWLQTGAELGIPGISLLVTFYALVLIRLRPLAFRRVRSMDPWVTACAGGVITALVGFIVSAQFVTVSAMELPYYISLLGAGLLKVVSMQTNAQFVALPETRSETHCRLIATPVSVS
jgi:putative inorganic carbon (HCO3(-)) transporter